MSWQERTIRLVGEEGLALLKSKHVLICGVGGVGGFAAEFLCRSGIGKLTLVDFDVVNDTNKNRQIVALDSTIGQKKIDIIKTRLLDINSEVQLVMHDTFLRDEKTDELLASDTFDYVIDAIDTLSPKVNLLKKAKRMGLKVVSSMGAGGKYDPTKIQVKDIEKTFNCTLAQAVRKRLKKEKIYRGIKAVFSPELVDKNLVEVTDGENNKKSIVGTMSYMPAAFGGVCSSVVLQDLLKENNS